MKPAYVRFSRNAGISAFATLSIYGRSLVLIPMLTRHLDVAHYGAWVQIAGLADILSKTAVLGLTGALVRFLPKARRTGEVGDQMSSLLASVGLSGVGIAAIGLMASRSLSGMFLEGNDYLRYTQAAILLVPLAAVVNLLLAYLRASQQVGYYAGLLLVEAWGYVGLAAILLYRGYGLWGVIAAIAATKLVVGGLAMVLLVRQVGLHLPSFRGIPELLRFGLPLLPLGIFAAVNNIGDRYVISFFFGEVSAGMYSVSYALGGLVGLFFAPISFVLNPALSAAWERNARTEVQEYLLYAQKYALMLALPATALITAFAPDIIAKLTTSEYAADPLIAMMVALGIVAMNLSSLVESVLRLVNRTHVVFAVHGLCAMCNLVANALLVPWGGVLWAAAATLLTYGTQLLLTYAYARRWGVYRWNLSFIAKAIAATAILVAVVWLLDGRLHWGCISSSVVAVLAYGAVLLALGGFERRELQLARFVTKIRCVTWGTREKMGTGRGKEKG